MTYRMFSYLAGLVIVTLSLLSGNALAAVTAVFATTDSYNNVVATAITDADYAMGGVHIAYATAKITSPDGRVAQVSASEENSVSVNAMLAIDDDAGTYVTQNFLPREYCTVADVMYYLPAAWEDEVLSPFLKINSTQTLPSSIARTSGASTYRVTVLTSNGCGGIVTIQAGMTRSPGAIQATIQGDESAPQSGIANRTYAIPEKTPSTVFDFEVKTLASNNSPGSLFVSPEVQRRPASCADRTLDSVKTSKEITVN